MTALTDGLVGIDRIVLLIANSTDTYFNDAMVGLGNASVANGPVPRVSRKRPGQKVLLYCAVSLS